MFFKNNFVLLFLLVFVPLCIQGSFDFTCLGLSGISSVRPSIQNSTYNDVNSIIVKHHEGCSYTLSRHHIIPYKTIREFFNIAIREYISGKRQGPVAEKFIKFVKTVIKNSKIQFDNHVEAFSELGSNTDKLPIAELPENPFITETKAKDNQATELIKAAITWISCNWFEGPSPDNRGDDPGETFEERVTNIVTVRIRNTLKSINDNMEKYINSTDAESFIDAVDQLMTLTREHYHKFDLNDWELVNKSQPQCVFKIKQLNYESNILSPSTSMDPLCLDTQRSLGQSDQYWFKNNILWNLTAYNLVSTKKMLDSIKTFEYSNRATWKEWNYNEKTYVSNIIITIIISNTIIFIIVFFFLTS